MPDARLDFTHDGERYGIAIGHEAGDAGDAVLRLHVDAYRGEELAARGELILDHDGGFALRLNGEQFFTTHLIDFPEGDHILIQILEAVPPLDPVIGCIIKAGFLAMLQQLLACRRMVDGSLPWLDRLRRIARCVADHSPGLAMNAAFRAARCIFVGGLF